jgi:thiol-disulfide isomerase/thioredoxin
MNVMALTHSTMLPLGTAAPDFSLPDTISGRRYTLPELRGEHATLLMFLCNHCPYVKHVNPELLRLARDYQPQGVGFLAISSNDVQRYPEDGPEQMREVAALLGYPFPYLYGAEQTVARAYRATCTPDFFLFDHAMTLAYRGRLDGSTPGNGVALSGNDLRAALDALLAGTRPSHKQSPSMGCGIKWVS